MRLAERDAECVRLRGEVGGLREELGVAGGDAVRRECVEKGWYCHSFLGTYVFCVY